MFRAIEAVYKANRQLLAVRNPRSNYGSHGLTAHIEQKLNDIGPNPASPKALGDLLMRWVSTIYCAACVPGL